MSSSDPAHTAMAPSFSTALPVIASWGCGGAGRRGWWTAIAGKNNQRKYCATNIIHIDLPETIKRGKV